MKEAYPLCWPDGYKRTATRKRSLFKTTMDRAQRFLRDEVARLSGQDLIVSTNLPTRNDGGLYTDWMRRKIDDPGVAIYFKRKGKEVSLCCDQYETVWENIYALGKGIEAMRGLERWGISEFLDRAFTGFTALPAAHTHRPWFSVLEISNQAGAHEIKEAYRRLAKIHHPDTGGNKEKFIEIQTAYEEGLNQL